MIEGHIIDIVFRNGTKRFRGTSPPEAWDNIHPVIKAKNRTFILLRVAAIITVLFVDEFFWLTGGAGKYQLTSIVLSWLLMKRLLFLENSHDLSETAS